MSSIRIKHCILLLRYVCLCFLCLCANQAVGQMLKVKNISPETDNQRMQSTEVWRMESVIMDQTLDIFVNLPFGYSNSRQPYPLLLALDADVTFGFANDIPKLMAFENTTPPLITVGISFVSLNKWLNSRQAYLTPSMDPAVSMDSGQADTFLSFLEKELLPFLDSRYRVKKSDRTLYGHSYAGLFTLYAMLKTSVSFSRYISTSPSVDWDSQALTALLNQTKSESIAPARLYLGIGENETPLMPAYKAFVDKLEGRNLTQLGIKSEVIKNLSHMASMAASYTNGLLWVFEK